MKTGLRMGSWLLALLFHLGIQISSRADALDQWFVRTSGTTALLTSATYGQGTFVAAGDAGVILTSTNGSDWLPRYSTGLARRIWSAGYGNGVFVLGGDAFSSFTNILVSTNTIDWPRLPPQNVLSPTNLYDVYFLGSTYAGNFHFLVGNHATILTATNIDFGCAGQWTNCNWALRNYAGVGVLGGVAYGNGRYVVVGDAVSMVSTDAVTWASNVANAHFYDVAFGNGVFVGVGLGGTILVSSNGVNWTNHKFGSSTLNRITYANGTFVAVGGNGIILTSTNGISWKQRAVPSSGILTGVTYGNETFLVTGSGGAILQSASVSIPELFARSSPSGISITMSGEIGRGYRIQTRTNLDEGDWEDFLSFTNTGPVMEFLDTSVTNLPSRFYRAVSP